MFLKGKVFYNQQTIKSPITILKERVLTDKQITLSNKKPNKGVRNLLRRSYFYRFILRKTNIIYKRTIGLYLNLNFNYQDEKTIYDAFQAKFRNNNRYNRFRKVETKPFSFGIVYLTHRRRNTFITIFKHDINGIKHVAFKTSVGLSGFTGPKKSTNHGKERVGKMAGSFLKDHNFTTVDLIFTKGISRLFSFTIRGLINRRIFVRHIYIPKRHSHGFTRRRKSRRT